MVQLLGLALLTFGVSLLDASRSMETEGVRGLLLAWAELLYMYLPIASGVLVGIVYRTSTKRLFVYALAVVAAMLVLDLLPASEAEPTYLPVAESTAPDPVTGRFDYSPVTPPVQGSRSMDIVLAYLRGAFDGVDEVRTQRGLRPTPLVVSEAFVRVSLILVPLWVMGIVAGALSWVDERVLFRDPRDETLAYALLAWLLGPASVALAIWLLSRIQDTVFYELGGYGRLAIPHLILGALGALGWWSRGRSRR